MIQAQDDQLDMVGHSVGVLKTMGKKIGDEIEEQNMKTSLTLLEFTNISGR